MFAAGMAQEQHVGVAMSAGEKNPVVVPAGRRLGHRTSPAVLLLAWSDAAGRSAVLDVFASEGLVAHPAGPAEPAAAAAHLLMVASADRVEAVVETIAAPLAAPVPTAVAAAPLAAVTVVAGAIAVAAVSLNAREDQNHDRNGPERHHYIDR